MTPKPPKRESLWAVYGPNGSLYMIFDPGVTAAQVWRRMEIYHGQSRPELRARGYRRVRVDVIPKQRKR